MKFPYHPSGLFLFLMCVVRICMFVFCVSVHLTACFSRCMTLYLILCYFSTFCVLNAE